MRTSELLWRQQASVCIVEILVGNQWVEHARANELSAAETEARKILADGAVREVRICEVDTVRSNTLVYHEKAGVELRLPPKLKPTTDRANCAVCGRDSPVVEDGANRWVVCSACERTLPCPL
jgi:hypothetical protein